MQDLVIFLLVSPLHIIILDTVVLLLMDPIHASAVLWLVVIFFFLPKAS